MTGGDDDVLMDADMLIFETGAQTNTGKVRAVNEDNLLVRPGLSLWAVSDGMGGHQAGRLASTIVIEELSGIRAQPGAAELLAECETKLVAANARLREAARSMNLSMIGATVAILLAHRESFACVWSGDSRVYRIRNSEIKQLTRDHSEAEEMVAQGILTPEEARLWPRRNVITRAIGVADDAELEMVDGTIEAEDVFVLCSDGLNIHNDDEEIRTTIGDVDVQIACDALIAKTLERGAKDNVTVIVVRCRKREPTVMEFGTQRPNWIAGE